VFRPAVTKQSAASLLFVGYRSNVSEERVQALRDAGYTIVWEQELGAALVRLRRGEFSVLVIGHLVAAADRRLLLAEAPRRNPKMKKVALYSARELRDFGTDATISVESGVSTFVEKVNSLASQIE
jgi:hypothetical protein